jgi:hypothetical protein
MANKTYKLFADKLGGRQASSYIGTEGEIFYDPTTTTLRISDGSTAGGLSLVGGTPTMISSGSSSPGAAAVANINDISINFSDGGSGTFKFNRNGELMLGYGSSVVDSDGKMVSNTTYGCFHKMANITAADADTAYSFDWYTDTTAHVNTKGVTVASENPTRVVIAKKGIYKVFVEMMIKNDANANRIAYIWLAKNGVNISETCVKVEIKQGGGTDAYQLFAKQWFVDSVNANDYLEVKFAVNNENNISLEYTAAQTSPYARPAIPSAVLTIT